MIKSSKLYFTDVGLLSYLLGIQETIQIERHPLRGEVFENLAILELIKHRLNHGIEPRLFFYRDSKKNEVDIISPHGAELTAIEIKSSKTFNTDFLKSLKKFQSITSNHKIKSYVVYGGTHEQIIDDIHVLNYENISNVDTEEKDGK